MAAKKRLLFLVFLTVGLVLIIHLLQAPGPAPRSESVQLQQDQWHSHHSESWQIQRTQPELQHYTQAQFARQIDQDIHLEQPLIIRSEPEQQLHIQSEHGLSRNQETLHFSGDTRIAWHQIDSDDDLFLSTDRLNYDTRQQKIDSQDPLILYGHRHQTHAIGMTFYLDPQHLQLHSEVRTHYAP